MKITCQSCQSKYTIADDKVLGKVVKIRCKKCAATIFVNGNDGTTSATGEGEHEPLSGYRGDASVPGWTVSVAEGDQRTMTDAEVIAAFRAGSIVEETYCWKDGMGDWVPLRETGELFRACAATREAVGASALDPARPDPTSGSSTNGLGAAFPAARRAGGRGTGVDLFGGVAQAGGEEDVLTSAPAKMPQVHDDPQKPTGARNESSVLFSLSNLTNKMASDPPPRAPGDEASGLIDIRQLSAQMAVEDKKQSRVDDIMNLSGGAFSPTLTAPVLSAPSFDAYAHDSTAAGGGVPVPTRSKGVILLAVGAGACLLVAAVGGALFWMRGRHASDADKDSVALSAPSEPSASAEPSPLPAPTTTPIPSAVTEPVAAPSASAGPKPRPGEGKVAGNAQASRETSGSPPAVKAAVAPPPPVEAGPFNMGEAKARLGAAAAAAANCKKANGPTGTGRVVVLFGPSGAPQSATVTGPPFEGTPTGACVAARFRAVRVPPFGGSPFSVSKSFTIN